MNINPLLNLTASIINLYATGLIIWLILNLLARFNIINSYHPFVRKIMNFGDSLYEPLLTQIRKVIPSIGGVDLSPLFLLLLLEFTRGLLYSI